jgi:hypothetical protein
MQIISLKKSSYQKPLAKASLCVRQWLSNYSQVECRDSRNLFTEKCLFVMQQCCMGNSFTRRPYRMKLFVYLTGPGPIYILTFFTAIFFSTWPGRPGVCVAQRQVGKMLLTGRPTLDSQNTCKRSRGKRNRPISEYHLTTCHFDLSRSSSWGWYLGRKKSKLCNLNNFHSITTKYFHKSFFRIPKNSNESNSSRHQWILNYFQRTVDDSQQENHLNSKKNVVEWVPGAVNQLIRFTDNVPYLLLSQVGGQGLQHFHNFFPPSFRCQHLTATHLDNSTWWLFRTWTFLFYWTKCARR